MRAVVHSRIMAKEQEVASAERLAAEGGIASDESAVAEPEIEADKGSEKKPVNEPDESAAAEDGSGKAGCPVTMGYSEAPRCGRKIHVAPDGVDRTLVCLMHSKDPRKQSGPLFEAFWSEFEKILEDAGDKEARFYYFVFPLLEMSKRKIQAICRFVRATFTQEANFQEATFAQDADFSGAIFNKRSNWSFAGFKQDAHFWEATFTQDARFESATFKQDADFSRARFKKRAVFWRATFTQAANFEDTRFYETAIWMHGRFLDQAVFRCTKFDFQIAGRPSAVFARAKFSKPSEIVFDDVDLSRALFHNGDVSQVGFTSSVKWGTRGNKLGLAVFDETSSLEGVYASELQRDGQRDYRAVAQIYQQLKKNYDSRLDYWTANEFHFGEMEMKRLAGPTDGRLLWLRRWWHRNLSFVALYRWASDYGNSYRKPLLWLLGTLILSAALFPLPGIGLMRQGATQAETYVSMWDFSKSWGDNFSADRADATLFGKGLIASVDTATFQKSAEYAPAYPWGRVVAIVETLLTSSLFALFLLAIRRQFRR